MPMFTVTSGTPATAVAVAIAVEVTMEMNVAVDMGVVMAMRVAVPLAVMRWWSRFLLTPRWCPTGDGSGSGMFSYVLILCNMNEEIGGAGGGIYP